MSNENTIESYLLRLIEDVAVVKTRLDNLDSLSIKVESALDKMEKQAIKMESVNMEIISLKHEVESLEKRVNELENYQHENVSSENKNYKSSIYAVVTTIIGAMILYILKIN